MIVIVDYGVGNLLSIVSLLHGMNQVVMLSASPEDIIRAEYIILPGVGSFDAAMYELEKRGLRQVLNEAVLIHKKPILGICLGVQLFGNTSEEGALPGLGWINMDIKKFKGNFKVPHMGWNFVNPVDKQTVFSSLDEPWRFYFMHSYFMDCYEEDAILATTDYHGGFVSAVQKENIMGVQFHPEKSHKFGKLLFEAFLNVSTFNSSFITY